MYALIAIGYTLVFGVLRLLNIAHGEVFMLGGFFGLTVLLAGGPLWAAILAAVVVAGLLGLVIDQVCFRMVRHEQHEFAPVISTVALGIVLVELAGKRWGTDPLAVPGSVGGGSFNVLGVQTSATQLGILLGAAALMVALDWAIRETRAGRALRAVAESPVNAVLVGVSTSRVIRMAFFVSAALAGLAGFLLALRLGVASSNIGLTYGIKALAVMAIGGLGNVRGAVVAGLLVGLLETFAVQLGAGSFSDLVVWAALIGVLLLRPAGLFGTSAAQRA